MKEGIGQQMSERVKEQEQASKSGSTPQEAEMETGIPDLQRGSDGRGGDLGTGSDRQRHSGPRPSAAPWWRGVVERVRTLQPRV